MTNVVIYVNFMMVLKGNLEKSWKSIIGLRIEIDHSAADYHLKRSFCFYLAWVVVFILKETCLILLLLLDLSVTVY